MTATPMDLSFAAQALSQFSHNPRTPHLAALQRETFLFHGNPRSNAQLWSQGISPEAEYRSLADQNFVKSPGPKMLTYDLSIRIPTPSLVMCDNASTIALANNPVQHARTKHIEIDCHFVRDKIRQGHIKPVFVSSQSQVADILTK
ncbi:homogeneously-staining region, partial [Tanacetum coccineum]